MNISVENEIILVPINQIKPYIKNPRINQKTIDLLIKVIPKVGFNVPIVIDKNNVIVKGHARYCAAMKLGMDDVPCIVTHANPQAIKADRITDNKIHEYTQWDKKALKEEIGDIDFDALGLDTIELGLTEMRFDTLAPEEIDGGSVPNNKQKPIKIIMHFKDIDAFRENEEEIRSFLNGYEKVGVAVELDDVDAD